MSEQNELSVDDILSKLDRNSRKARIISFVFTIAAVIALIVILFLTYQAKEKLNLLNKDVEVQQQKAEEQGKLAEEQRLIAEDRKAKNALLLNDFQSIANVQNSNKSCEEKKEETNKVLALNTKINDIFKEVTTPTPSPSISKDLADIKRVYIQIVDESQRAEAKRISQMLRSKGLNIPDIELVKGLKGKLGQTQIRYFNKEDEKNAQKLLGELGLPNAKILFTPLTAEKGQLEIWFADSSSKN